MRIPVAHTIVLIPVFIFLGTKAGTVANLRCE